MLVEPSAIDDAKPHLSVDDFSLDSHRKIYRSILSLHEQGEGVDLITVSNDLKRHKELESINGISYLASLSEGLPRHLNIESYVRIVLNTSRLRQVMLTAENALAAAEDDVDNADEIIARTVHRLTEIGEGGEDTKMERMGDFLNAHYEDPDLIFENTRRGSGISSGYWKLDQLTNGFHRGELTIVAARPSMGKTAWAGTTIDHVARSSAHKTAVFALEQSKRSLMTRMLCGRAQASLDRFSKGTSTDTEKTYIRGAMNEYRMAPLFWEDKSHMTVTQIRAKVQGLIRSGQLREERGVIVPDLDLVLIDQLSHIGSSDFFRKGMQRDEIGGEKALRLKKMAKELNIPVVLIAQISRQATKNKDFIPTLADLSDSGYLEQHADNVIFLHRPEYYDRTDESLKGKAQMIVAKQRDGAVGTVNVQYVGATCRWIDEEPATKGERQSTLGGGYSDDF